MEIGEAVRQILKREQQEQKPTPESVALSRVVDLERVDFLTHEKWVRNLRDILSEGVLSGESAAKKGKKDYQSVWGMPLNRAFVSTFSKEKVPFPGEVLVLIKTPQDVFTLPEDETTKGRLKHTDEVFIKDSNPNDYVGLWFYGQALVNLSFDKVLEIVRGIWNVKPQSALPIYDPADKSLLWPRRMTHEEIVRMLAERQK